MTTPEQQINAEWRHEYAELAARFCASTVPDMTAEELDRFRFLHVLLVRDAQEDRSDWQPVHHALAILDDLDDDPAAVGRSLMANLGAELPHGHREHGGRALVGLTHLAAIMSRDLADLCDMTPQEVVQQYRQQNPAP